MVHDALSIKHIRLTNLLPSIALNLDLHIPSVEYQSLAGKMNVWIDLKFMSTDDDQIWWKLDGYGVNP